MSAVRWGRANGWGILSSVEILDVLPVWMAEREEIKANLAQHLAAMARYQEVDGSFHTVLDQPGTYRETTAASAFACAARRAAAQGCAPADGLRAEDALQYVAEHVAPDGTVRGASGGTPVMCSVEEYGRIPCVMSYYGQGMALLALCAFAE